MTMTLALSRIIWNHWGYSYLENPAYFQGEIIHSACKRNYHKTFRVISISSTTPSTHRFLQLWLNINESHGHFVIISHYAEIPGLQNNVRNSRRQRTRQNRVWKRYRFTDGLQSFGEITQMIMIMKMGWNWKIVVIKISGITIVFIASGNDSWSDWQARNVHFFIFWILLP